MMITTQDTQTRQRTADELYALFEEFSSNNPFPKEPAGLYHAVRHIMSIPGKRLRPILCMAAAEMFGADARNALEAAAAVELYHNSTLVHDDIMDAASIRRGIPTVHEVFGTNAAINAGDVMIIKTYELLARLDCPVSVKAIQIFSKAAVEIIEGQTMDLDFETRTDVTEAEYLKMIEYKTSVLLAASLQMGATIAHAEERDAEAVYAFGKNLGISFQIKDDLLDAYGDGTKTGKKVGGDIVQNKRTLLYLRALSKADPSQKNELKRLESVADEREKIEGTLAIFNALNIKNEVEKTASEYYENAIKHLQKIEIAGDRKQVLYNLAERIFTRDF
jgi:geranylgeranyl diphosphate synthase type II